MPTDTVVNNLVINKLTKAQYDNITHKSDTELYLVPDEIDTIPTQNSENCVTSGGVYTALADKVDTSDLATVATSGSYNDLSNKPTIPIVPTNVSDFTNDAGYLTSHQDISGKEDRVSVRTINGTSLSASIGTYYVGSSVGTLAVTLPTITDATHIANVVLNMAMGTSPSVTFTAASGVAISYSKDFSLEASKEYEVNCLWNGTKWLITAVEFESQS